ncbi:MAG: hypothetical protein COA94_05280 [Rickettsiales bacterium]|nr:MAG: hypothetical protein COA94_05280 [Rickettsiales bacterium]
MAGYFGGGIQNVEKPVEHYKIIDQRKNLSPERARGAGRFDEVMKKAASKLEAPLKAGLEPGLEAGPSDKKVLPVTLRPQITRSNSAHPRSPGHLQTPGSEHLQTSNSKHLQTPEMHRKSSLSTGMNPRETDDGTKIALKRLSKEMENQLMGMFWVMIDNARENDPEGGFAEKMFRTPYLHEVVKSGADPELGEIGKAIYNNLVRNDRENVESVRAKK